MLTRLGALELVLGRPLEALSWLEAAVDRRPGYPVSRFYLGRAFFDLGRIDEAVAAFERALELDAQLDWAREGLERCGALSGGEEDSDV